jgi:MoaA/NifB/PqqE/SkfB family radical SAM enzyme
MPIKHLKDIVSTVDFHVTCECTQECPYCWGPQNIETPVDTETALRIIDKVKNVGVKRIVFTGGDPLKRGDIGDLLEHAEDVGLEVAISTTGDELTPAFLDRVTPFVDLISVPLDGPSERVNAKTKKEGHFTGVMRALAWLRSHPSIDVKVCTPVTKHNIDHVPATAHLVSHYAGTTNARVFYNIFQAFPRAMSPVEWAELIVTGEEFEAIKQRMPKSVDVKINFLDHDELDRLYLMVFPDGRLVIPSGKEFLDYGRFLEVEDFESAINDSRFDRAKHKKHSQGWQKKTFPDAA